MRLLKLPLFLIAIQSLISCEYDSVKKSETSLLTVTIDPSWQKMYGSSNSWLIVNDEHGEILDYKKLTSDGEIVFSSDREVTGNIGVTTVFIGEDGGYGRYIAMKSYLELAKGEKLVLNFMEPAGWQLGGHGGIFSVNVSHPGTSLKNYFISDASGNADGARQPLGLRTAFLGEVHEPAAPYLVFVEDETSNLRYKIIDAPQKDAQYNFNLEDLNEFDKTVEFGFPPTAEYAFAVYGDEPEQNIHFRLAGSQRFRSDETEYTSNVKGGYLNNFENPVTLLHLRYDTYENEYNNMGLIPDGKIDWPSSDDWSFVSKSINDFEVTSNKTFVYRISRWTWYEEHVGINWDIYSPIANQVFQKIPSEIFSGIAALEESKFAYAGSKIFTTSSRSYEDVVEQTFEDKVKTPYSEVSISIGW